MGAPAQETGVDEVTEKNEALRLAEKLNLMLGWDTCAEAANELRRLHAENERLRAQRDALLEVLKYHQEQTRPIQRTIDAIAKAEENT